MPPINLTMEGGDQFYVTNPVVTVSLMVILCSMLFLPVSRFCCNELCYPELQSGDFYCLGIVKSEVVNIIGRKYTFLFSSLFCL